MARYNYHVQKLLVCICTVCAILALLLIFLAKIRCKSASGAASALTLVKEKKDRRGNAPLIPFQLWRNKKFARLPKIFWQNHLHGDAFWNQHQVTIDYHFNPILNPQDSSVDFDNSLFYESILRQSFSDVSGLVGPISLPQILQDFVSSMRKRDYPTLIEPTGLCGAGATDEKETPLVLLAIKSTVSNFKNRQAIRETWGQAGWVTGQSSKGKERGAYIRRIFLFGREAETESSELLAESKLNGDILQWDFSETFFNLSVKQVLFWKWFSRYCGQTHFVFQGDDDIFVNTVKMIIYLQNQLKDPETQKELKNFMVGYIIGGTSPIRDDSSKYFIPDNFYKGLYPVYACGGGFIYSGMLAKRMFQVSKRVHLFPIDDAYVGMCMIRLNALPIHHPAFLIYDFPGKDEEEECSYHKMLMVHKRTPTQMFEKWEHLKKTEEQCWDVPLRSVYIPQHLLPIN